MFLLLLLILTILSIPSVVPQRYSYRRENRAEEYECDDIAIVGAGIAGTYAAWRLRHQNKRITLYEFSDRVGGKLYTVNFPGSPDINVELGARRFFPDDHKLLHNTIRHLGLPVRDYGIGSTLKPSSEINVRGVHIRTNEMGGHKTPFRLLPSEQKSKYQLKWELYRNYTNVLTTTVPEEFKKFYGKTSDGVELYKQSVHNVYRKYLSREAYRYLIDSAGFRYPGPDASASCDVKLSPPVTRNREIKTVSSGMNSIPVALMDSFIRESSRHNVMFNRNLRSIKKTARGLYMLEFERTTTINSRTRVLKTSPPVRRCAKQIILAINRLSLEYLDWEGLYQPRIREYLTKAVKDIPTTKMFLEYSYPWWRRSSVYSDYALSDTPLRATIDFGTSKLNQPTSVLQAMYVDVDPSFWTAVARRENGNYSYGDIALPVGEESIAQTSRFLSELYKIPQHNIPRPINGQTSIWEAYPYGGAVHVWMPGYIWPEVERQMVKPSSNSEVYLACNAFNSRSLSGWANSALQAVELVMPYFGLRHIE